MSKPASSLQPLVPVFDLPHPIDWQSQFVQNNPLEVEIGFGMGEVLVRNADQNAQRNYIGIEQNWERIYKTLRKITMMKSSSTVDQYLRNVRILRIDARIAFERLFAEKSIERIYCLFPCPWPKKGHVKHRLFSNKFLKLLNSRLTSNGQLVIVTDFYPYYEWVLEEVPKSHFSVNTQTIEPQFDTKFERKWQDEGQEEFFEIVMDKTQHAHVAPQEEVELKSYKLNDFDYERFELDEQIQCQVGEEQITIIRKDSIYDEKQNIFQLLLIINEQELMQHFRILIFKDTTCWRVMKADGQNFFPTPGIAKALEIVFQAAKQTQS